MQWTRPFEHCQPGLWVESGRQALQFGRVVLTGSAGDNLLCYSPCLPTMAEASPLQTLRQIFQLKIRYGRMPGLGTGLKARWKRMGGKSVAKKTTPYCYPPWLNEDLAERFAMQDRWEAFWKTNDTGANRNARHPLHHDVLMSGHCCPFLHYRLPHSLPDQRMPVPQ